MIQQPSAYRVSFSSSLFLILGAIAACSSGPKKSFPGGGYQGLGKESVEEQTLKQFAPAPLPPELSRKIQSYLDIRSPGMGILSSDKSKLYFSWRVTGNSQVWRLDSPKGFPVQMTGGEDSTGVQSLTPDNKWLVLSRDRNGEENPGLYLQSADGGPLKVIQHKAKVQTLFEFVSADSQWIYYRSNDVKPDSYAIYRYHIPTEKVELVFSDPGYWVVGDHNEKEKVILTKAITNSASEHYEFDLKTKVLKPLIGVGEKEDYTVRFSALEGQYLVLTPKLGEFRRLYLFDGKKLKPISPEMKWDVAGFAIDRARTHILYEVNEGGYTRVKALDAGTLKPIEFPAFKEADHVYIGSMSRDGKYVMLGIETSKGPRTSFSYSFETKALTQWLFPSAPEVDTKKFVRAALESYTARDGTKISMFVRRPAQCADKKRVAPCPVVVHFHGGPEAQSQAGFSVFAQMFVDEGIVFVEPNVRGSEGYGKAWLHSDDGPLRLNVLSDIEDAAIEIKKSEAVSGVVPKVGVMGWSYGGYSTLMAMTKYAGAYDAGVALVGMSNLITFLNNTAPYRRQLRIPEYGDPEKDKEALQKLSAVSYLDQVKAPLLVIQGANDPRVPVGEAIQLHKALESKKIASPLIIFADEWHGTDKRSNKVLELGHAIQFLKNNLL